MTRDELFFKPKSVYETASDAKVKEIYDFAEGYKTWLDASRTERLAVREAVKLAEKAGFKPWIPGKSHKAGEKLYFVNREKALTLAVLGKKSLAEGCNIAAAHVDNPRLDLKQHPLYEDGEMAYFKTHYYGGIKKYQWVTTPLALVGVVVRADGEKLDVSIGLNKGEPRFVITDLLPHLAADQMKKNAADVIPGEGLNLLLGSRPDAETGSDRVKLHVMKLLNEKYGITEADIPEEAWALTEKFWPGPLTLVLARREAVPLRVTAGLETVAMRCPDHPLTREVLRRAGVPVAAPSANLSGKPSTTTAAHCVHDLWGKVEAILDGGPCRVGVESTILDLSVSPPRVLRPGGVTLEQLRSILPETEMDLGLVKAGETPKAPGMKYRHYSPQAEVRLLRGEKERIVDYVNSIPDAGTAVLCFAGEEGLFPGKLALHFRGTVLTISHDRYFLDRAVQRIVELVDGKAELYAGNYSFFVEEKQRRYEEAMKAWEKSQKQIAQLHKAADDLHLWAFMGNDKLHKRAFSMEKRIDRLKQVDKPTAERRLKARFGEKEFRGDDALVVHELTKSFDGRTLFENVELQVTGGERIALIGDNGTGKSTFLSILMGQLSPDRGSCRFGPAVKTAMLEQQVHFERMDRTLVDTMLYEGGCTPQQARDRLGAFGFSGEDAFKFVGDLSGGELSRLRLCILMKEDVNFLILDEPTNHLDILSREWMEDALTDYSEALLFVSHDRWFISRFATRIWELEDGAITDWRCSFEEYRARKDRQRQAELARQAEEKKQLKKEQSKREKPGGGQKALQKKLAATEREIAALEERLKELEAAIEANATDYEALGRLFEEKAAAEAEIEGKYEDWGALSEELEGSS